MVPPRTSWKSPELWRFGVRRGIRVMAATDAARFSRLEAGGAQGCHSCSPRRFLRDYRATGDQRRTLLDTDDMGPAALNAPATTPLSTSSTLRSSPTATEPSHLSIGEPDRAAAWHAFGMRNSWLVSGLIGGLLALFSALAPVAGIIGGALVLMSVVLQYLDSRPVDRIVRPSEWTHRDDGDWEYRPKGALVRGRTSVQVFLRSQKHAGWWEEGMTDCGVDGKGMPWVLLPEPIELRVIVR